MAAPVPANGFRVSWREDDTKPSPNNVVSQQRKLRVVLLDDEPSILKTWSAILEAHGGTLAFLRDAQRCAVVISLPAA